MNERQAINKLKKLLGPKLMWQVNKNAPTGEDRVHALATSKELSAAKRAASEALEARRRALLNGDEEYQRLSAEYQAAREASEHAMSFAFFHRIEVGTSNGIGFHVKAQADNWDEAVSKIEAEH